MTDNELLLAMSEMMDKKFESNLKPIENRLSRMESILENIILPRLQTIESCYTDTYNKYKDYAEKMELTFDDVSLIKKVVAEHSKKLEKIS